MGLSYEIKTSEMMMATTNHGTTKDFEEVQATYSAPLAGESVPTRVLIAPWGLVESTNGSFVLDDESARRAVDAFAAHGTDLPIDYEHQTLGGTYASPTGKAPAAGWIKRLVAEPGVGLLAEIEWTDEARKMVAAKEYRYLSPVAIIRKADRKLVAIHSAALTNKPAIVGMTPIIAADGRVNESDQADEEPLSRLKTELNLGAEVSPEEVLIAASLRLENLGKESRQQHVDERIREAMRAGKLVEAQRLWAEALVAREEDLFDEWLRSAPVVVQPGATTPPDGADSGAQRRHSKAARARAEFRANPILAGITSEDAFVADALREARSA